LISNQGDMAKFDRALTARRLLSDATYEEMWTPQRLTRTHKRTQRGLGWDRVVQDDGAKTAVKTGELPGWCTRIVHDLERDVSVVVAANLESKDGVERIAAKTLVAARGSEHSYR
jgi:CubicO group peptidase (beta-lactamase class C family)